MPRRASRPATGAARARRPGRGRWLPGTLLLLPVLAAAAPPPAHELHETYADLAIEGAVVAGRIRFFRKDLERALGPLVDADAMTLRPGAEADALLLRYLREHLRLEADGTPLVLTLLHSGEDAIEHHAGWSVVVRAEAAAPVGEVRVRNTLLFEVHDDQRNVLKLVRFPETSPRTYSFSRGEEEQLLRF